jgi:hypothetical protein
MLEKYFLDLKFKESSRQQLFSYEFYKRSEKQRTPVVVVSLLRQTKLSTSSFFFSFSLLPIPSRVEEEEKNTFHSVAKRCIYIYIYTYTRVKKT